MLACPNCKARLSRGRTPHGIVHACRACGGRMVGVAVLCKASATERFLNAVWHDALAAPIRSGRSCPHCSMPMAAVVVPARGFDLTLDVCMRCSCIWFDPGEYSQMPRTAKPPPLPAAPRPTQVHDVARTTRSAARLPGASSPEPAPSHTSPKGDLHPRAREALAMADLDRVRREHREEGGRSGPDEYWQYIPALLGLPVECDQPPVSARPWVTWGAALLAVIVFLVARAAGKIESMNGVWGFIPAEWYRLGGLTVVTSFFMHGGIWHLAGNMYFLLVFGDNVEDDLGRGRFAGLLVGAHVVGMIAHALLDPRSMLPCVGASAGISAVIAYYALAFPRARLGFLIFFRWFRLSAAVAFVLWIGLQLLLAWRQVAGFGSISALAHLGGAAVGVLSALALRKRRRDVLGPSDAKRGSVGPRQTQSSPRELSSSGRRGVEEPHRWSPADERARAPATGYLRTPEAVRAVRRESGDR